MLGVVTHTVFVIETLKLEYRHKYPESVRLICSVSPCDTCNQGMHVANNVTNHFTCPLSRFWQSMEATRQFWSVQIWVG